MNEQQQQEAREAFEMNCPTPITRPAGGEYLDDRTCHGWQAYLAATERMQAMVDEVTRERDQYRDTLLARHGGEPLALLSELDEARERIADLTRELAEARQDAERWRMLMDLGTCHYNCSPERPAPIWSGSKRVYFHECDEQRDMTLPEYIDAAIDAAKERT